MPINYAIDDRTDFPYIPSNRISSGRTFCIGEGRAPQACFQKCIRKSSAIYTKAHRLRPGSRTKRARREAKQVKFNFEATCIVMWLARQDKTLEYQSGEHQRVGNRGVESLRIAPACAGTRAE